jgi:hypothetical protein
MGSLSEKCSSESEFEIHTHSQPQMGRSFSFFSSYFENLEDRLACS